MTIPATMTISNIRTAPLDGGAKQSRGAGFHKQGAFHAAADPPRPGVWRRERRTCR